MRRNSRHMSTRARFLGGATGALVLLTIGSAAFAADYYFPIVMPITGFMSVEGGSQRNGAVMAFETAKNVSVEYPIFDTGTSAAGAAACRKARRRAACPCARSG